jgi:hypothetical protein
MNTQLFFIRKIKALFLKMNLHILFLPFWGFLINLAYLAKLSKWRKSIPKLPFDDFYNKKVNYGNRFKLHSFVLSNENLNSSINYFEFGVADGISLKWWVSNNTNRNSKFYGFDTFTGLPEDFGPMKKNDYDTKGNFPSINDPRCSFIAGMFQDSMPEFFRDFDFTKRSLFHMDADLYSSTLYVLTFLAYKFKKDDIIIFDEFGVPTHEFRAFNDFISSYQLKFQYLGAINNYLQVAIKIL